MKTTGQSTQLFSLRDLLSSALVATVDADTATARRYFNHLCSIAFEEFDSCTCRAGALRTLTFRYVNADGVEQSLNIPVLSLVPLPLLQVKDADFGFDIRVVDMLTPDEADTFTLDDDGDDASTADQPVSEYLREMPQLRVALLPSVRTVETGDGGRNTVGTYVPNLKVNVRLQQADVPGGLSRFLQVVNNMDMKLNL